MDHVFCVPGESYLSVLDALHDASDIKVITCRHEGGAAMMADAFGKLQNRPGICMVTRGPGATNASAGLHVAMQDATPLIMFIGQIARPMAEREAFQELDYRRAFGQLAKWVAQIDDASRIPEMVSRAFHTATSGRPGPVVLALPEDMLEDVVSAQDAMPYRVVSTAPGADAMAALKVALERAERPLMILGGGAWDVDAVANIQNFAQRACLPVAAAFRRQDRFDNRLPNYVGHVGIGIDGNLAARVRASDLLLVVGARLGEMTTSGYTLIDIPVPRQVLIHIHPHPEELGRVYQPTLAVTASPGPFAAALARLPVQARSATPMVCARRERSVQTWDLDTAYKHARQVGLLLLSAMSEALDGDLDRVESIIKVFGLVNATADYVDHFKIVNGCSDLFLEVFGDKGTHARTAAGANSLPNGIPVEIEAIVAVR
ncbi:thiamine pyrophosphate-binding protein [Variovorax sp. PBS-H4]|uniref:thiamine pyrophosphate-binding protein n=1 Tax=Variovorax sp. PBS-H4 TaxID=434008 RepID=UPI003FCDD3BE